MNKEVVIFDLPPILAAKYELNALRNGDTPIVVSRSECSCMKGESFLDTIRTFYAMGIRNFILPITSPVPPKFLEHVEYTFISE